MGTIDLGILVDTVSVRVVVSKEQLEAIKKTQQSKSNVVARLV